jgi:hypothetical protein
MQSSRCNFGLQLIKKQDLVSKGLGLTASRRTKKSAAVWPIAARATSEAAQ